MTGQETIEEKGMSRPTAAETPCVWGKDIILTLKVLVATIDAQWEGMGDVGSARYEPALLPHERP